VGPGAGLDAVVKRKIPRFPPMYKSRVLLAKYPIFLKIKFTGIMKSNEK
jgi:hypothetical protein